jgi:hypothetical protein
MAVSIVKPLPFAVAFIMVAALALAAVVGYSSLMGNRPYAEPSAKVLEVPPQRSKEDIAAACRVEIEAAYAEAQQVVTKRTTEFSEFIRGQKAGARPFAEDVTSWYGKWRVVNSYLPFADHNGHQKYVQELFETHLLPQAELGTRLKRAVEDAVLDVEGIQNRLAVKLRREIAGSLPAHFDSDEVASEFRNSIEHIVAASQWDAQKSAGSLVVSEVVSTVGTQVLVRLGVSAGILGTGAANSWWSFGGSVVIGLVADMLWEWIDDPTGDVEREVAGAIERLAQKCDSALSTELQNLAEAKHALWIKAADSMIAARE